MVLINIFIFIGIIAAAVSGTLVGMKKRLDWFGVICLAVATALGGGMIRDIMIGNLPPVAFIKPVYFLSVCQQLSLHVYSMKESTSCSMSLCFQMQ